MPRLAHCALLVLALLAAPVAATSSDEAPEQLLQSLYAAHRPWADAPLDLEDPAVVARWFCPGMQKSFAHLRRVVAACPEGDSCGLEFDPILSAQDYGDGEGFDLRVEALPSPPPQSWAARFHLFGPEFDQTELHYRLAQDAGRWCIEDIVVPGPDGMSLKEHLDGL